MWSPVCELGETKESDKKRTNNNDEFLNYYYIYR